MKMNDFQFRLRDAIYRKGITPSELSRISNVGKADISNYLRGKYLPKQDKCYELAKALDVDPGWLMTGQEPKIDLEEIDEEIPQTEEARILAKGIDKLPQEQREQALSVIKAMFAKYADYFEKENDDEP